jgi:hypothetical protein
VTARALEVLPLVGRRKAPAQSACAIHTGQLAELTRYQNRREKAAKYAIFTLAVFAGVMI